MNPRALFVLLGQTGALLGAGFTAFSLGLWSLKLDGSLVNFALLGAASTLPRAVLAPLAGVLAARASPRQHAVTSSLQVRVFAIRRMNSFAAFAVCFVITGPLADLSVAYAVDRTTGLASVFIVAGSAKVVVSLIAVRQRWVAVLDNK